MISLTSPSVDNARQPTHPTIEVAFQSADRYRFKEQEMILNSFLIDLSTAVDLAFRLQQCTAMDCWMI
jgi:hypothetical protein